MKTFEKLKQKDINEIENIKMVFLEYPHIDELEIVFDFIDMKKYIVYKYKKNIFFLDSKTNNIINIDSDLYADILYHTYVCFGELKKNIKENRIYDIIKRYFGNKKIISASLSVMKDTYDL